MRMEIGLIKHETRKSAADGFDRSVRWDRNKQFGMFLTLPKIRRVDDKYQLSCSEMKWLYEISVSVSDVIINNYSKNLKWIWWKWVLWYNLDFVKYDLSET